MRTNIILNEALVKEAMQLTGIRVKKHLIEESLRTLIQIRKRKNLLNIRGKIKFAPGYDYKAHRS